MNSLYSYALISLLRVASALPLNARVATDISPDATYDYVIVGCGISGLVVANRLSASPDVSVLCIEAGPLYV